MVKRFTSGLEIFWKKIFKGDNLWDEVERKERIISGYRYKNYRKFCIVIKVETKLCLRKKIFEFKRDMHVQFGTGLQTE